MLPFLIDINSPSIQQLHTEEKIKKKDHDVIQHLDFIVDKLPKINQKAYKRWKIKRYAQSCLPFIEKHDFWNGIHGVQQNLITKTLNQLQNEIEKLVEDLPLFNRKVSLLWKQSLQSDKDADDIEKQFHFLEKLPAIQLQFLSQMLIEDMPEFEKLISNLPEQKKMYIEMKKMTACPFLDGLPVELRNFFMAGLYHGLDSNYGSLVDFLPQKNRLEYKKWRYMKIMPFLAKLIPQLSENLVKLLEENKFEDFEKNVVTYSVGEAFEEWKTNAHEVVQQRIDRKMIRLLKSGDDESPNELSFLLPFLPEDNQLAYRIWSKFQVDIGSDEEDSAEDDSDDDTHDRTMIESVHEESSSPRGKSSKSDKRTSSPLRPSSSTQPPPNLDWNSYGTSTSDSKTPLTPMLPNKTIPPAPPLPPLFAQIPPREEARKPNETASLRPSLHTQPPLNSDLNIYETPTSESKAPPDPLTSPQTRPSPPPQDSKPLSSSSVATQIPRQESQNEEIMRLAAERRRRRLELLDVNNQQQAGRVENISGTHVKAGGRPLVPQKSSIFDAMHEKMKEITPNIEDDSVTEDHMANAEFDSI